MDNNISVSVRSVVEFILRSGNIDTGFASASRAVEGTRLHQAVQKRRKLEAQRLGVEYESEKRLSISYPMSDFAFLVDGRADGVYSRDGKVIIIEEIKSTLKPLRQIELNTSHWHWAQAKCYGYICCRLGGLESVEIWLTYGQLDTLEWTEFKQAFSAAELEEFFADLMERYRAFAKMDLDRISERNRTAKPLGFPYSGYRSGQRELCVAAFAAISGKKKLFAQAPTGIGKTVSALFPSVKAMAENKASKIFYCTAKTVTRVVAEETLRLMEGHGLRMRSITLTAKDKICFLGKCKPLECPNAKGHFDRVNEAILDLVQNSTIITREVVLEYARKHLVCPFELSLDASLFCDCIICDYNHVYDPKSKLKRFFTDGGDFIVLADEAHNLADRAREMFSADLSRQEFETARKGLKNTNLGRMCKRIGKAIHRFAQDLQPEEKPSSYAITVMPDELVNLLGEFAYEAGEALQDGDPSDELMELYFRTLDFIRISELYDSRYTTFIETQQEDKPLIKLFCLDPSLLLSKAQSVCRASVFFSATLTPLTYFRQILGGDEKDYTLKLKSPFSQENLCLMADRRISTKYKDREQSYVPIAKALSVMAGAKPGNYIAFFPSYDYLNRVLAIVNESFPKIPTLAQSSGMDDKSREAFLDSFKPGGGQTLLGFAVLGGVFSEGIDLKSDRLIGAAVIGVGLPLICPQRDAISRYYQESGKNGFDFAYVYPGMNKVLQAAGRVIRSETDKGAVLLIDSRYARSDYKTLFPPEWSHCLTLDGHAAQEKQLKMFWEEKVGQEK